MSFTRTILFSALVCFSFAAGHVHAQTKPKLKPPEPPRLTRFPVEKVRVAPQAPATETVIQAPSTQVFDQAGDLTIEVRQPVMASSQVVQIREQLAQFKERHAEPIAVLLMPDLNRGWERMDDYAPQVSKKWQIGQADAGNGLLVIVAFGKNGTQAALSFAPSLFARLSEQTRGKMMQDFLADLRAAELAAGLSRLIASLDLHLVPQNTQQTPPLSQ
jgi:uncharacterized membrane protein YgcG